MLYIFYFNMFMQQRADYKRSIFHSVCVCARRQNAHVQSGPKHRLSTSRKYKSPGWSYAELWLEVSKSLDLGHCCIVLGTLFSLFIICRSRIISSQFKVCQEEIYKTPWTVGEVLIFNTRWNSVLFCFSWQESNQPGPGCQEWFNLEQCRERMNGAGIFPVKCFENISITHWLGAVWNTEQTLTVRRMFPSLSTSVEFCFGVFCFSSSVYCSCSIDPVTPFLKESMFTSCHAELFKHLFK